MKWAHRAWRTIPAPFRRQLLFAATSKIATVVLPKRIPEPGSIAVIGLLSAATGIGEGARLCLRALNCLGFSTRSYDVGHLFLWPKDLAEPAESPPPESDQGGLLVVHVNPPHLPLTLLHLGRRIIRHRKIIGYWTWELPTIPPKWKRAMSLVDEIWTPSEFVASGFREMASLPVRVVPYPVLEPGACTLTRQDFEIPNEAFVVLSVVDVLSGFERKNPVASIRAFQRAFGDLPQAHLIIKILHASANGRSRQRLEEARNGSRNITIMNDILSRGNYHSLIRCSDVILSLHRAEGFGIVLAEAMRIGKPVVATGWSGNLEFMTKENSLLIPYRLVPVNDWQGLYDGRNQWAEPDVGRASAALSELYERPLLRRSIGAKAAEDTTKMFDLSRFNSAVRESM